MPARKVSARTSILHLLKRTGGSTVQDVSSELGITTVAVRKHLSRLENDGLIIQKSRPSPRGRPAVVYCVSETSDALFPQGYNQLLVDFLQDLSDLEGETKLEHLFQLHNERLAHTYRLRIADKPLDEAVRELARARDDEGYMATVREENGELVLAEHNCPIYDVAQRFPQICQCEQRLFQSLLKVNVTRETTVTDGASSCRYRIAE